MVWGIWLGGFTLKVLFVLFLALFSNGVQGFMDFWLSFWTVDELSLPDTTYLYIYAILTVVAILTYVFSLVWYWPLALSSARKLHQRALRSLLNGTMGFFESVPGGRILNRFAKDVDVLDQALPESFKTFFSNLIQLSMFIIVIAVAFPWFLIALGPLFLLFMGITLFFKRANRQIRRVEGVTRSPVFQEIATLLTGLRTMKVYGQTPQFVVNLTGRIDSFSSAVVMFWTTSRWLAVRLDLISTAVVLVASIISISLRGTVPPSIAAIAITYSMRLGSFLQWTFRNLAMMESSATSCERIVEYMKEIPNEHDAKFSKDDQVPENWPRKGEIVFENVSVRYNKELPFALCGIDFRVREGEHVGVVGRTGAGKSTLTEVLFRLRELDGGSIRIDGIDISTISLPLLRSRLAIVTQDPVLFGGSLRFNLDPFNQHTNDELWEVLRKVNMVEFAESNGGLEDFMIEDGGLNISAGERQILCLCRIVLKNSTIICLDEATANIDTAYDTVIQNVLRKEFKQSTTLSIAHRLNTVIDSDKILVLDHGLVKEFDHPKVLVGAPSTFRDLLLDTGARSSRSLIHTAKTSTVNHHQHHEKQEDHYLYMEDDFNRLCVEL
jgi:ABC-type multidrug transport system fused ATPase/permease subunit